MSRKLFIMLFYVRRLGHLSPGDIIDFSARTVVNNYFHLTPEIGSLCWGGGGGNAQI